MKIKLQIFEFIKDRYKFKSRKNVLILLQKTFEINSKGIFNVVKIIINCFSYNKSVLYISPKYNFIDNFEQL